MGVTDPSAHPQEDELFLGLLNVALADEELRQQQARLVRQHEHEHEHEHNGAREGEPHERQAPPEEPVPARSPHARDGEDATGHQQQQRGNPEHPNGQESDSTNGGESNSDKKTTRSARSGTVAGSMAYHQQRLDDLLRHRRRQQYNAIRDIVARKDGRSRKERQRYNSDMRLLRFTNHLVVTSDVEDDQNESCYYENFQPNYQQSAFYQLFDDDQKMQAWREFDDLAVRDQDKIMKGVQQQTLQAKKRKKKKKRRPNAAGTRFAQVDKRIRQALKQHHQPWAAVEGLETALMAQISSAAHQQHSEQEEMAELVGHVVGESGTVARYGKSSDSLANTSADAEYTVSTMLPRASRGFKSFVPDPMPCSSPGPHSTPVAAEEDAAPAIAFVLTFKGLDAYQRLMLHGLARFYKLKAVGHDLYCGKGKEREKIVEVLFSSASYQAPDDTLAEHLRALYSHRLVQ